MDTHQYTPTKHTGEIENSGSSKLVVVGVRQQHFNVNERSVQPGLKSVTSRRPRP